MKKIVLIALLMCFCTASDSYGQGFFNKIAKEVEKVSSAIEKIGKPKDKKTTTSPAANNETPTDSIAAKVESATPLAPFVSDLQRANLKGNVTSVVENVYTYIYDENGMLIRFSLVDTDPGEFSCNATVIQEYKIQNNVPLLIKREVLLLKGSFNFEGEFLREPESRSYTYDPQTNLLLEVYEANSKTRFTYKYDQAGRKVRMETAGVSSETSPMLYLYDTNGRLKEVHMGEVSEYPHETFVYDAKGRIAKHKSPSGTYLYKYNENEDVVEKQITDTFGEDEDSTVTFKYTYDAQGNWIKCITYFAEDDTMLTTRKIQYAQ